MGRRSRVSTPAVAVQQEPTAFRFFGALAASCARFREDHRDISVSLGVSALVHLALLIAVGASMYTSGEDDRNVPELSVQLETRAGPNSEEFTEAALPKPAPEPPAERVVDDPGTVDQTIASDTLGAAAPLAEQIPDTPSEDAPQSRPQLANLEPAGTVITTTGTSGLTIPLVTEPRVDAPVTLVPQPEKAMLTKNMTKLAQKLLDTNMTRSEVTWSEEGRQYTARLLRQPAADSTGLEQVIAEIVTDRDGKRMKTRLSLKRLAFSHFTQLVNFWDPNIQLHDDVIDGRFHSNTEIGLAYAGGVAPRFFGKVTTSASTMMYGSGFFSRRKNQEIFQGGTETKTERVTLPRDMPDIVSGGDGDDRHVFDDDTRIIFNADGTYVWRKANGEGPLERADASDHPRYLIGDKGAKLYVSGTVSGIYTVYSPSDIEIENDLVYAKDPRDTVISRDFLALISGRDIKVATAQVTGAGDLHVHAAMFARHRFMIESVKNGRPGTLFILGSLTAGTILETEPRYSTKMDYDTRFEYLRPASFPMTRRYEVDSWDADWKEVENPGNSPTDGLVSAQ